MNYLYFPLLLTIITFHFGYGDEPYKVINIKIPHEIWQKALYPTPVLKSGVTITIPINVQDYDDEDQSVEAEINEDLEESDVSIINDAVPVMNDPVPIMNDPVPVMNDPVPVMNDPTPVINDPVPPVVVTESPPLQDEVATPTPVVSGQVIRMPCHCRSKQCGCCTGTFMEKYSMKACGNITFIPEDFVFDINMNMNNKTIVRRRVSASDPPPICFNPRRAPFIQVCAELSNIQIRNKNAHACFHINANIADFPIYSASFRCFKFGASGIKSDGKKPRPVSSTGPKPVNLFANSNSEKDDDSGGFLENTIFGEGGLFGGGGSSNDNDGPFDGLGDAIGNIFDFE